jgi:citrate lyase subunit beta / citryl-CoA lyase
MPTPLRSLLFVPGNKHNMLEKALDQRCDALVPDMEDSVPDAEKPTARETIRGFLPRLIGAGPLVIPRVNALGTPWFEEDLAAVVAPGVFGISIGKIETAGDVELLGHALARLEKDAGLARGTMRVIPWIESAKGIVHAYEICAASERIVAAAFGAEDFTHDMAIERLDDPAQIAYARSALCIAARAAGVLALDTPYFQFRDDAGLREDALAAKSIGFKGKFAIHPGQIDTINACFRPSDEEIEWARRVVAAFEIAEREGRGSTSLDGRVIDVPVVKRARAVLAAISEP